MRVLAVANIENGGKLSNLNENNKNQYLSDIGNYSSFETGATFLGVACIKDPVREEVKPAISQCKIAGIRVIMITGDSKETALSIA